MASLSTTHHLVLCRPVPLWEKALCLLTVGVGLVGGAIATWSAVGEILQPGAFQDTCFNPKVFLG